MEELSERRQQVTRVEESKRSERDSLLHANAQVIAADVIQNAWAEYAVAACAAPPHDPFAIMHGLHRWRMVGKICQTQSWED